MELNGFLTEAEQMTEQAISASPRDLVDVTVACYNSAQWIDGFIESLLAQSATNWRLIARDDGSEDGTLALLKGWQEKLGQRMLLLDPDSKKNLGMSGNGNALAFASTADWVLFGDPDDIWLSEHISLTVTALKNAEQEYGADVPICVCTDALVVDGQLNLVAESFWHWSKVKPLTTPSLNRMAIESVALGTTMIVNRALLRKALPFPLEANGDWWIALVAVVFGQFIALPERTIKYRRHGANATKDPLSIALGQRLLKLSEVPTSVKARLDYLLHQASRLAETFLKRYGDTLEETNITALRRLSALPNANPITKRLWIVRYGFWFSSLKKNIGLLMFA